MVEHEVIEGLSDVKITIGLVTYNRPAFLKEAIQSVLQQSYKNFELIVSNDYLEIPVTLEALGIESDPRIKILNQIVNLGEAKNMNHLLAIAQGEWFVWLADDDLLHSDFLMSAQKNIRHNQCVNLVGFFSNYCSGNSPIGVFPQPLKSNKCLYYDALNFITDYTSRKISLVGCYGVMHTATLKKIGGMPRLGNSFGPYSDNLIPILLAEHGSLCWLDERLVFLRTHPDSLSCKSNEFSAYTSAEEDFLRILLRVCASKAVNIKSDLIVENMIKWFFYDEWDVLNRDQSLSKYEIVKKFYQHQINENLPMMSFKKKVFHFILMIKFFAKQIIQNIYRKIRSTLEWL